MKVAVIGAGHIGGLHAQNYAADERVQLVAVCDMDAEKARPLAEKYGAAVFTDLDEMLSTQEIDAVSVATAGAESGGHHFAPTMQVLEAGIPALTEKPISNDINEARQMVKKAREKNLVFAINLNHRFTPMAEQLKAWQSEGRLGETLFINMGLWINNPSQQTPYHHIRALHPHSIDVMRFFGGDISRVQCFMTKAPGRTNFSTISLNVQFASGAVGNLSGSWDAAFHHPIERCEVAGDKGRAVIENVYERLTYFPRESREKTVIENGILGGMSSFQETHTRRLDSFVTRVLIGKNADAAPVEGSGEEGLAAQEVIEAAIRSHEKGTVEEVSGG